MAKTFFLQIRCTQEDRTRLHEAAASQHLDDSTWARQVLLREVERLELKRDRRSPALAKRAVPG